MTSGLKKTIILWGVADSATLLAAAEWLRDYEKDSEVLLIINKARAEEFKNIFKRILTTNGDIRPGDLSLLVKTLFLNTRLHLIPCSKDYNLYYAVAPILNKVAFFQKRALIGLLKDGTLTRIPIQCQNFRAKLKFLVFAGAASFLISQTLFSIFAVSLLGLGALFALDHLFLLYIRRFKQFDYFTYFMFKREEIPYVSFGWMHPYDESYFNRLIFSAEGPANQLYEINEDYFPVYNSTTSKTALQDRFDFANTHHGDLLDTKQTWFVLGGSVAQGLIGNPGSYHRILENELKTAGLATHVLPWAIGGYQSTQSRVLAECSLMNRPVAGLISLDFYNDVLYTILGVPPGDTQRSQRKYLAKTMITYKILDLFFDYLLITRFIWQKLYARLMTRHMESLVNQPKRLENTANHCVSIYIENACRLFEQSRKRHIPYVVFVQPFREDSNTPENNSDSSKTRLVRYFYSALRARIKKDPDLQKFIHICPHDLFTKTDFVDEVHLAESGQAKLAVFMASFLKNPKTNTLDSAAGILQAVRHA